MKINVIKMIKRVALLAVCAGLVFWLGSLAACEYDSWRYGGQFKEVMVHDIGGERFLTDETLKVLRYSETQAEIYAVDPGTGCLYWFRRAPGQAWVNTGWDVVWSKSGNADRYVFPYISLEGLLVGQPYKTYEGQ